MRRPGARTALQLAAGLAAAAEVARGGRWGRRAAARAALAGGIAALTRRPAAIGAAAAAGAAVEAPTVGAALAAATAASVRERRDASFAAAGVAVGLGTTRVWPTAPRTVDELRRHGTKEVVDPAPEGDGVVIVVNPGARTADDEETAALLAERLPAATVHVVGEDDDVGEVLARAAKEATVALGAAGGDGTVSAAAQLAHEHGLRLLALPAGTLNHFARDLGLLSLDDAIDAVQTGHAVRIDLATADGRAFVNTASFGAYTDLVEAREKLQDRIGKWPAVAVALVTVLRRATPVKVELDGVPRRLWLGFVGNGRYQPSGFAPSWREVLDDGQLDLRLVDAAQPLARVRLVLAVLTGRLGRTTVYQQRTVERLSLRVDDDVLHLALDGEVLEVPPAITLAKERGALLVHAPHR